ncbi:mPR-like GPCR protein [Xylariaceae sp. FL1272]|nr:mPR-like GPCR protein [Xylariaceae sp. FL1272]
MVPTPRLRMSSPHKTSLDLIRAPTQNVVAYEPAKGRKGRLISYEELPEWHQDNEYIRHGYRPISGSARISLQSWTYIHNETGNIITHLVPAVLFLLGEWYILQYLITRYPGMTGVDIFIFAFFLLCTVICYGLSVTYHTLMNHSNEVEKLWLRMDLVGITVYNLGAFTSGIYMIFWCEPVPRAIYWTMIATLGSINIFIMANPRFQTRKHRVFRTLVFATTAISGFAPVIHGCVIFGIPKMLKQSGLPGYLFQFLFLFLGAVVYGFRFPESRYPGKFDIWGSSHQLFHVLVTLAAVSHLTGILLAFEYSYTNRRCASH